MNTQRFRRRTMPWRSLLFISLVSALAVVCRPARDPSRLDPQQTIVLSGDYLVSSVTSRGSIEVVVPTDNGDQFAEIEFLGIAISDEAEVERNLSKLEGQRVRLRFDRRRVNEAGILQAYVFAGDELLNESLVRQSLATEDTHAADSGPIVRRIKKAEQEARTKDSG